MNESECLSRMVAPGTRRPGKYRQGVIQVYVTRACDKACYACTQGSNLGGKTEFMPPEMFAQAVESLRGYYGVVGVFGGNPAMSPYFGEYCRILRESWVPFDQRGLWCNNPRTLENAQEMRATFDPSVSNINVHLDRAAYDLFRLGWPECRPVGLDRDSRHSPPFVAMRDVLRKTCEWCGGTGNKDDFATNTYGEDCDQCRGTGQVYDEGRAWELISNCDVNQHWSALIGVFRGELRAWFCEIAGAQAMLHQHEPDYPDTGRQLWFESEPNLNGEEKPSPIKLPWWRHGMASYREQVRKHCHDCGVPLRGYGELAQAPDDQGMEQVSATHETIYKPKRKGRRVEVVTQLEQLGVGRLTRMTDYIGNSAR